METPGKRLKKCWVKSGYKIRPGVTRSALAAFESANKVILPGDFKSYLLAVNGYDGQAPDLLCFAPLKKMEIVHSKTTQKKDVVVCLFADYMWSSHMIALVSPTLDFRRAFVSLWDGSEAWEPSSDKTFSAFVNRYLSDPAQRSYFGMLKMTWDPLILNGATVKLPWPWKATVHQVHNPKSLGQRYWLISEFFAWSVQLAWLPVDVSEDVAAGYSSKAAKMVWTAWQRMAKPDPLLEKTFKLADLKPWPANLKTKMKFPPISAFFKPFHKGTVVLFLGNSIDEMRNSVPQPLIEALTRTFKNK